MSGSRPCSRARSTMARPSRLLPEFCGPSRTSSLAEAGLGSNANTFSIVAALGISPSSCFWVAEFERRHFRPVVGEGRKLGCFAGLGSRKGRGGLSHARTPSGIPPCFGCQALEMGLPPRLRPSRPASHATTHPGHRGLSEACRPRPDTPCSPRKSWRGPARQGHSLRTRLPVRHGARGTRDIAGSDGHARGRSLGPGRLGLWRRPETCASVDDRRLNYVGSNCRICVGLASDYRADSRKIWSQTKGTLAGACCVFSGAFYSES